MDTIKPKDTRLDELERLVRERISDDDPSHDWSHVQRVLATGKHLARLANAREEIVLAAALLHDLVNIPKNAPDRVLASRRSAAMATGLLEQCRYTSEEIDAIRVAIEEHSYSLGLKPSTTESAVLQDADRLDALGAIGVLRATTCGAAIGAAYYDLSDPLASRRPLNDKKYTVDHYYTKLLKLVDGFQTEAGRSEAKRRTDFMRQFLDELLLEISVSAPCAK